MPVLFNKQKRLPKKSSQSHFGQTSSIHDTGPRAFHRADSSTSKRTFHSTTSGGTNTVIHKTPSTGLHSVTDSLKKKEIKGCWNKFKAELKDFYKRRHIKYLLPLLVVMCYMLVGAILFYWLESNTDHENMLRKVDNFQREKKLLLKRMEEILLDKAAENPEKRKAFIEEAVDNFHKELEIDFGLELQWNFMTAMYFAGTLFTTIGYGDIACSTGLGRIMTVVYGLIGIPIMLMTLNHMGKFLYKSINEMLDFLTQKFSCCFQFFKKKKHDQIAKMEQGEATSLNSKNINSILEKPRRVSFDLRNTSDDAALDQLSLDLEVAGTQGEASDDGVFNEDEGLGDGQNFEMVDEQNMQNMPVTVALFITIGWIFFCAALFKLWEDWTYAESWYFMFISMSTIGLGDVAVKRRDMMVLCFVFVIIGLSLVSMCINVIQQALEDLYKQLLMKLLMDYQATLSKDGDHKGASMGMMKMWGHSKTAKYLMPMLSAGTRRHVMNQIQEEAKENGVELPPIFEDLDEKTGMPKILAAVEIMKNTDEPERMSLILSDIVKQSDPRKISVRTRSPLPTVVYYEADAQTEVVLLVENSSQTTTTNSLDSGVQTEGSETPALNSQEVQTDSVIGVVEETQTPVVEMISTEMMTLVPSTMGMEIQTDRIQLVEENLQTNIVDYLDNEVQTDKVAHKSRRSQTVIAEFASIAVQTEPLEEEKEELQSPKQARKRMRKILKRKNSKRRNSHGDNLGEVEDEDNTGGSYESLDWDPVDGLHAEKQKPVKDLKRLFDSFKQQK